MDCYQPVTLEARKKLQEWREQNKKEKEKGEKGGKREKEATCLAIATAPTVFAGLYSSFVPTKHTEVPEHSGNSPTPLPLNSLSFFDNLDRDSEDISQSDANISATHEAPATGPSSLDSPRRDASPLEVSTSADHVRGNGEGNSQVDTSVKFDNFSENDSPLANASSADDGNSAIRKPAFSRIYSSELSENRPTHVEETSYLCTPTAMTTSSQTTQDDMAYHRRKESYAKPFQDDLRSHVQTLFPNAG